MKRTPLIRKSQLGASPDTTRAFVERGRKSSAASLARHQRKAIGTVTLEQRTAVRAAGCCVVCGCENSDWARLTFSHLWPGSCSSVLCGLPMCVRPGGAGCHRDYEDGKVDLLALMAADWDRYRPYVQHMLEHALPVEAMQRLAGARIRWEDAA